MSLFDILSDKVKSTVNSSLSSSINVASTKVSDAVSTTFKSLGSFSSFSKLGANTPSLQEIQTAGMIGGKNLINGVETLVSNQIKNILGNNEASISASSINAAIGNSKNTSEHIISLSDGRIIINFNVLPNITEGIQASYEPISTAQSPAPFQKYKGTDARTWTINVKFISRNSDEATINYRNLCIIRGWLMPFFGAGTARNFPKMLGAPPPVLKLSGLRGLIGPTSVVINSLNWTWPSDIDYIPTNIIGSDKNWVPFPVILEFPITCVECLSTSQINQFDLLAYRNGDLYSAFNIGITQAGRPNNDDFRRSEISSEPGIISDISQSAEENFRSSEIKSENSTSIPGIDNSAEERFRNSELMNNTAEVLNQGRNGRGVFKKDIKGFNNSIGFDISIMGGAPAVKSLAEPSASRIRMGAKRSGGR